MLGDVDRQQSARGWLAQRPANLPLIRSWEVSHDHMVRPPKGTTHLVLDTPAALHGDRLNEVMKLATHVLVPLQPSIFDIRATHDFIAQLLAHKRGSRFHLATLGMRTREGTIATDQLRAYLGNADVTMLGFLRDTQNYVHLAAHGRTLFDVAPSRFERDLEQWQPITAWLDSAAPAKEPKDPKE
jgi:chromosome partitioning protein